ncbi:transposase, partial [Candidatus Cardinium hertigii]|uniref:transposase n=1 Tax=Candidatus Cardinium hertigii TaxID=247481 RepID=UPI003D7D596A
LMSLENFANKWDKQYPQIAKSWYANWNNLMVFLQYPNAIRKVIYTTNIVESVNSQFRRVTKNKRVFPNDLAVFKTLYLTINYMTRTWTMPIHNWSEAIAHFLIKFEHRIYNTKKYFTQLNGQSRIQILTLAQKFFQHFV